MLPSDLEKETDFDVNRQRDELNEIKKVSNQSHVSSARIKATIRLASS